MSYQIRHLNIEKDFPRIAELNNTYNSIPVDAETLLQRHHDKPSDGLFERLMLVDENDQVVGFSNIIHNPWEEAGRYYCWMIIDPELRGRGLGTLLGEETIRSAREHGATKIRTEIREDLSESFRFANNHRFETKYHIFESTLHLATFDKTPFRQAITEAESTGIRFATIADFPDNEQTRRNFYELVADTARDIPDSDSDFPSFETWCGYVFAESTKPFETIIARDGEKWVGVAALRRDPGSDTMYHALTAIDSEYRGRKIAQALKVLCVDCGERHGVSKLLTNNHSANAPMIAINKKFGYQPVPGSYVLELNL